MKLALIGAGGHSRLHHGPGLAKFKQDYPSEVDLVALCDLDESKAQQYADDFGFQKTYTDYNKMIEKEKPEALIVISRVEHTREMVADLLPYHIPMMIEKPVGDYVCEAEFLVKENQKHQVPMMVSVNRRFSPASQAVKKWLNENTTKANPPLLVQANVYRHQRLEQLFTRGVGIHPTDLVLSFMTAPVKALNRRFEAKNSGVSFTETDIHFDNGSAARIYMAPTCGCYEETYDFTGDGYRLKIDFFKNEAWLYQNNEVTLLPNDVSGEDRYIKEGGFGEIRAFITDLNAGRTLKPSIEEVIPSMRITEALEKDEDVIF